MTTTATRSITKTHSTGKSIVWTVKVSRELRERIINADGDMISTGKMELVESTDIIVTVDGAVMGRGSYIEDPSAEGIKAGAAGRVGKIGMMQATRDEIESAIASATAEVTTPEIEAHTTAINAAKVAAAQGEAEYQAHAAAVEKMMTLNGHTF